MNYRGYTITHKPGHPVTGQWRAERFGVGMCAGTRDALLHMIDQRIDEAQRRGPITSPSGYAIP